MEAGMADCLINMTKIPTFVSNCQKDIDEAQTREESEEKTNIIKTNQDQIDAHQRDYSANQNMYGTMLYIVQDLRNEYFAGIIGKVLFFIFK